jgi:hypothetical protein
MKRIEVHLGYYKQGDDLYSCLEKSGGDPIKGLRLHAESMKSVSEHLVALADAVEKSGEKIEIQADTHFIGIDCSDELADSLISKELADKDPFEDENEED